MDFEAMMAQLRELEMMQYGEGGGWGEEGEEGDEEEEEEEGEEEEEDMTGKPPLYKLIRGAGKGRLDLVQEALAAGAKVDGEINFLTAMGMAIFNGEEEIALFLLEKGANANHGCGTPGNMMEQHPLMLAVGRKSAVIVRKLLEKGANPNYVNESQNFPLLEAVNVQEEEIVSALLEHGANVDQYDYYKTTALIRACAIDSAECIEALVKGRPNAAIKDKDGQTALHKAAHFASPESLRLLLDYGCNIEQKNSLGETPLTWTYRNASKDCGSNAKLLISAGADLDAKPPEGTPNGMSALRTAWQRRKTEGVVQLLLSDYDVSKEDFVIEWTPGRTTWHPKLMTAIQNYRRPLTLKSAARKSIRKWMRMLTDGQSILNHNQAQEILSKIPEESLRSFVLFEDLPETKSEVKAILRDHQELQHLYDPEYEDF